MVMMAPIDAPDDIFRKCSRTYIFLIAWGAEPLPQVTRLLVAQTQKSRDFSNYREIGEARRSRSAKRPVYSLALLKICLAVNG